MKKKITIALGILIILTIIGVVAVSAYRSSESYRQKKASKEISDINNIEDKSVSICIDGVTYFGIGMPAPVEPDESAIEYVEIPVGGDATITAFARLEEGKLIVCKINGEWYKFHSMEAIASSEFLPEEVIDEGQTIGTPAIPEDAVIMQGKIIEINNGRLIVEPVEGSAELESSDSFSVPIEHMDASPEPQVGNIIEVFYDGSIEETYPAMLGTVYFVRVVE